MKQTIYLIAVCLMFPAFALAAGAGEPDAAGLQAIQGGSRSVTYKGRVVDERSSVPLAGVAIVVKDAPQIGMTTNSEGEFRITIPVRYQPLVSVSYIGYQPRESVLVAAADNEIRLKEEAQALEEVQVIAYGQQKKVSVTGAIASINTKDLLKSPSGSAGSALAGAVTGISSVQISGQPGAEDPDIYVRGTGSLSNEASKPLILVDGVERSFFQMDSHEIESVTVLKDASSTAVFGVRGANGVILVTTRRGTKGKPQISWNSTFGLTQSLRHLTGVDSYTYATLYSEAQRSDNPGIKDDQLTFSPFVTEMFRTKADPIMFPDVDWSKYIFKNVAWQTQHNATLSGGGDRIRYFVSLGYLDQDGMMKRFDESYDPNYNYQRFNYRSNIDVDITNTTQLKVNIGGRVSDKREPLTYSLWQNIMWCTPFASPGFVDGKYIYNYKNNYIPLTELTSGLDCYYNWGYRKTTQNELNLDLALSQNLDVITKGLTLNVKGAYNTSYYLATKRAPTGTNSSYTPIYLGSITQPGMDVSDPRFDNTIVYQTDGVTGMREPMTYGEDGSGKSRNWYVEASLNYQRTFGDHAVSALLLYNQSKTYYPGQYTDIPTAYVGYVGRLTYAYKNRYLVDFNAGYNGSENFAPKKRYGFFPAGSVGWIVSEENFMKNQQTVDFLKLRASFGLVGNDKYSGARFLYLDGSWTGNHAVWQNGYGSYQFGMGGSMTMLPDAVENTVGNSEVTWEKVRKQNYGIDLKMFGARLSLTADYFFEHRYDILSTRNTLPSIVAIELPLINLGEVDNRGYEISLGWNSRTEKIDWWVQGNVSYSKNKIIFMDEVMPNYPWMAQTGRSTGLNYGYRFDRFLQADDFDADGALKTDGEGTPLLPVMSLGSPRPGDALFKDLNGDGKIDGNDKTYFGYSQRPDYVLGLLGGFRYKNFEISMQWTAGLHASRMLSGEYRNAFGSTNGRALLKFLADGRWTPENPDARFPRLTFLNKSHYLEDSDLWLMDGSYLRLKVAEIGYTFRDIPAFRKVGVKSLKVYFSGYNLLTLFSDLNDIDIDPEGATSGSNIDSYPNVRIFNFGVNITF